MMATKLVAAALVTLSVPGSLSAQVRSTDRARETARAERDAQDPPMARGWSFAFGDDDRPRIGVSTSTSGKRDTLGLLISELTPGGPAEKAGLEEGNRIAAINGVNLRLSPSDAGESDMEGVAQRRLIRELGKLKAGDEVELRIYANGQYKNVKVKTADPEDLMPSRTISRREREDRAVVGISLGTTNSRRDTLGVFVARVSTDGPAEKAGIVEGDRIQSLNGVDMRVAREDAGDFASSSLRVRRLNRELAKLNAGDEVELRVYSGGQTKTVRVKSVKASELPGDGRMMFFGDGVGSLQGLGGVRMVVPRAPRAPRPPMGEGPSVYFYRSGG